MRLTLLTALTMIAFAANSVLNRMALTDGGIDAVSFGTIRLLSGALVLSVLVGMRSGGAGLVRSSRIPAVLALVAYIYGFSLAYRSLDAGLGALILFGVVQITMFGGALAIGERPPAPRWLGAIMAFAGLVWLLWPGPTATAVSLPHGLLMAVAGVGWGIYSLAGRGATNPLAATAGNFVAAAGLGLVLALVLSAGAPAIPEPDGVFLAVFSGAVTSGLGYALWYAILPQLAPSVAAVVQLTVPILAMAGGAAFLGEALTVKFALAALLVLGGVGVSVIGWPVSHRQTGGPADSG